MFLFGAIPIFLIFYKVEYSKYTLLPPDLIINLEDIVYNWTAIPFKFYNEEWYFKFFGVFAFLQLYLGYGDLLNYNIH